MLVLRGCLALLLPQEFPTARSNSSGSLRRPTLTPCDLTPAQRRLVAYLDEHGEITIAAAKSAMKTSLVSVIPALEARGLLRRIVRVVDQPPSPRLDRFVRLAHDARPEDARGVRQQRVVAFLVQQRRLAREGADGLIPIGEVLRRANADRATLLALQKGASSRKWICRARRSTGNRPRCRLRC